MPDDNIKNELQPHAFARTVGYILQATGGIMLILSTCTCCGFAFVEGGKWHSVGTQFQEPDNLGLTILLLTVGVGAFCLVAFGLGMQSDRGKFPAVGSALTSIIMCVLFFYATWNIYRAGQPWYFFALSLFFLFLSLLISLFCISALVQIIKDPQTSEYTAAGEIIKENEESV